MNELADKADKVRRVHDEMGRAFAAELDARAQLLQQVIEAIRPALHALSSRLTDGLTGISLPLAGKANRTAVVLTTSGELKLVDLSTDSRDVYLLPEEAIRFLSLPEVVSHLSAMLDKQLEGKAITRTRQAQRTAERLRALATLLRDER